QRGSKNRACAIIKMRTCVVIFARNRGTLPVPLPNQVIDRSGVLTGTSDNVHAERSITSTEEAAARSGSHARRLLFGLLKLVVSVGLLVLLFSRVDVDSLWESAKSASLSWLSIALGIYFASMVVSSWRWHLLLEAQRVHMTQRGAFASFLVASFFNNFLPSNIGGDVIRIR